jgi:hypothetical protein
MTKLIVVFCNFVNSPKTRNAYFVSMITIELHWCVLCKKFERHIIFSNCQVMIIIVYAY